MGFEDNGSMMEPPRLSNTDNFSMWKNRMIAFLNFTDINLMETIKEGRHIPLMERSKWSDKDKQKVDLDNKAKHILSVSLPDYIYRFVMYNESAKEMWDNLIVLFEGTDETREYRNFYLSHQYYSFTYKHGESLKQTYIRFSCLINESKEHNIVFRNEDRLMRFLRSLPPGFEHASMAISHSNNLKTMSLSALYGSLRAHEEAQALRSAKKNERHEVRPQY